METNHGKFLALTFDDGPSTGTMTHILKLLESYHAYATFFVVGENITDETISLLHTAVSQGHEIGNHTQSHLHMSTLGKEDLLYEITSVQHKVEQITGAAPQLFRPPYLDVSSEMQETIPMPFIGGYGNYDWDPQVSVEQRLQTALDHCKDGAILLMHCFEGNTLTEKTLELLLPILEQKGYQLVTVSQLFTQKRILPQNGVIYHCI